MSSRDHDLVPSLAADEPAITVPASPPRRDPVEDADASFTRKRPRLDSGSNSLRAMSTDPESPTKPATSSHEQQVEMTIRPHPPSSPVAAGDGHDDHANSFLEDPLAHDLSPIVIPSAADESDSPPVMILDDDDDEPAAYTVRLDAEDHFRRFPFTRAGNYSTIVRELAQHIHTCTFSLPTFITPNTLLTWDSCEYRSEPLPSPHAMALRHLRPLDRPI